MSGAMADDVSVQWEHAAAGVLRRSGRLGPDDADALVRDALTRRTLDGIPVTPLGTPEVVADVPDPGLPGEPPFVRGVGVGRPGLGWDIRALASAPDARRTAEHLVTDLENGATSVWLQLGPGRLPVAELATALDGIYLDLAPVVLEAPDDPVGAARALVDLVAQRGGTVDGAGDSPAGAGTALTEAGSGSRASAVLAPGSNLGGDPVGAAWRGGHPAPTTVDGMVGALADLAPRAGEGVRALVVDGTAVHDSGASDVVEVAYLLAVGTAYLRSLVTHGLSAEDAASLVEFRLAATDEQFPTIAKLRAARLVWSRVAEVCGVPAGHGGMVQHAVTSAPMTTRFDPWTNLLRGTVAAFAAGVGGATAVTVLPFDHAIGQPDAFSRRIARNTSSLLIQEAHVAVVTDPAGGSYAVERLTADLASAAWALFQRIEAAGGILAGGWDVVGEAVTDVAARRDDLVARRRLAVTGVSEFPLLHETLPTREPFPEEAPRVRSYAHAFEELRSAPAAAPVFLATMGTVAQHTPRATFMANLLAAGGVDTVTAGPTSGVGDVLAGYDRERVVCLAGPDAAYAEWGAELAEALRSAGAATVLVAGRPVEWADDSAATGDDALAFLHRTRTALGDDPAGSLAAAADPTEGADR